MNEEEEEFVEVVREKNIGGIFQFMAVRKGASPRCQNKELGLFLGKREN